MSGYFQAVMSELWMNNNITNNIGLPTASTTSNNSSSSSLVVSSLPINNTNPVTNTGISLSALPSSKQLTSGWAQTMDNNTTLPIGILTTSPIVPPSSSTSTSTTNNNNNITNFIGTTTSVSLLPGNNNQVPNSAGILEFDIDMSDYERYTSASLVGYPNIPRTSIKNYSKYAGDITVQAFEDILRYLYGFRPRIDNTNAKALLVTASYFDIPPLMSEVADYIFANLSIDNVIDYLLLVYEREYGEPGKLIEDASLAYLYRNAIDINPLQLRYLPLSYQKKLLLANELYTPSEYIRYKLALTIKQAVRKLIIEDMIQANIPLPSHILLSSGSSISTSSLSIKESLGSIINPTVSSNPAIDDIKMNMNPNTNPETSYPRVPSNTRSSVSSPLGQDTTTTPLSTNTVTVRIRETIPTISTTMSAQGPSTTTTGPPPTPLTVRRLRIDTSSVHNTNDQQNNRNTTLTSVNNRPLYDLPSASSLSTESSQHVPHNNAVNVSDTNTHPVTVTMPAPLSTRSYNSMRRLATFSPASYTSNNVPSNMNYSTMRSNQTLGNGRNTMEEGDELVPVQGENEEDHTSLLSTVNTIPSSQTNNYGMNNGSTVVSSNHIYHHPIGRGRGRLDPSSHTDYSSGYNNTSNTSQIFRFPSQIEEESGNEDIVFSHRNSENNMDTDQDISDTVTPINHHHYGNQTSTVTNSITQVLQEAASRLWSSSHDRTDPYSSSVPLPPSTNTMYDHMLDIDDYPDHQQREHRESTFISRDSQSMEDAELPYTTIVPTMNIKMENNTTYVNESSYSSHSSNHSQPPSANISISHGPPISHNIPNSNNLLPDQVLPLSPAGPVTGLTRHSHTVEPIDTVFSSNTPYQNMNSPSWLILQSMTLRDFYKELEELETAYTEIFQSIRWIHLTPEQLEEVRNDHEVPTNILDQAIIDQTLMREKVSICLHYNNINIYEIDK